MRGARRPPSICLDTKPPQMTAVVLPEKKESPLDFIDRHDYKGLVDRDSDSLPVHWDDDDDDIPPVRWEDIPLVYRVDFDENLKLSDLMDYDPMAVDADRQETNCPGKKFSEDDETARKVDDIGSRIYIRRNVEYQKKCEEIMASGDVNAAFPSFPLKIFPEATGRCVLRGNCHHREFKTRDTSTTRSTLGYREPSLMLQIFSLCLSFSESYPVSVYGIVAVRDNLEPLRNLAFNRPCRDDALTVDQDSFILPLCSPRRGMYLITDRALLEVDLWVKEEGDGSSDKHLLSMYAEIEGRYQLAEMLEGQISSDLGSLVIDYLLLEESVEAVIKISGKIDHSHHVRFTAFTSGFDHEIVLFDDKFSGNGKLFQNVVAVKAEGKLDICLKLEESLFWWTFQGAVGAFRSPDDPVLNYFQFEVMVLFAPKNFTMSA